MARWLAGELTQEERAEFEASPQFAEYQKLQYHLKSLEKPPFDTETLREKVWQGIAEQQRKKVIPLKPLYYTLAIAASILVVFGLFFSKVTYETGVGETTEVLLPDGTTVALNAKSVLTHRRFFWQRNKRVSLTGEGFFEVTKGAGFQVETASGTVSVLGTEFNIKARKSDFELHCYEGRVRYDNIEEQQQSILNAGDAVALQGAVLVSFKHTDTQPLWQTGRSRFTNAALLKVMEELTVNYGIRFEYDPSLVVGSFTGSFVHNDLSLALKSVFVPMGIAYTLSKDQKTVSLYAR